MHVAHSLYRGPNRTSGPKNKSADGLRREQRLAAFKLRDLQRVEAEYADELKEIREIFPNWKPNL